MEHNFSVFLKIERRNFVFPKRLLRKNVQSLETEKIISDMTQQL